MLIQARVAPGGPQLMHNVRQTWAMTTRTVQLIAVLLATVPVLAMPAPPPIPASLDLAEQSRLEQAARAVAGDLGIRSIWAYRATDSSPIQAEVVHEYFFSTERYKKYKTNTCVREQIGWKCQFAEIVIEVPHWQGIQRATLYGGVSDKKALAIIFAFRHTPYIGNSTPEPLLPHPFDVKGIARIDSDRYRVKGRYRGGHAWALLERRHTLLGPRFKATLQGVIHI